MNIRSIGPALYLAAPAMTKDRQLDFVYAREEDRSLLIDFLDAWLGGRKRKFPLPLSRFRELKMVWNNSRLHFDGKVWPRKKQKTKRTRTIEIKVKPSALVIFQPARCAAITPARGQVRHICSSPE